MSYTIVDDEGVIQVRASIRTADEFGAFIEQLDEHRIKLECKEHPPTKEKPND